MRIRLRPTSLTCILLSVAIPAVLAGCSSAPKASASGTSSSAATGSSSAATGSSSAATGSSSAATGAPAPLSPPVPVSFAVTGTEGEAGIFVAQDRGYFKAEGLDVTLQHIPSFATSLPLLATGQLDFATGGPNPDVWNAIENNVPVKIVAAIATGVPGTAQSALVVSDQLIKSGQYKGLSSLKGMTIAVNALGSSSEYYVEEILARAGLTESDVHLVALDFADMESAISDGKIDAALSVEPYITSMSQAGLAKSVITTTQAVPGGLGSMIVISPVFASQDPAAADRVMYAFLKGQRDYLNAFINGKDPAGKASIIKILVKNTPITNPALYDEMGLSGSLPTGEFNLSSLSQFQTFFISKGLVKKPLDPSKMVDFSYLNYANAHLEEQSGSQ
jgi:NitT/TauT family transport system substrate-binding protein